MYYNSLNSFHLRKCWWFQSYFDISELTEPLSFDVKEYLQILCDLNCEI